MKRRWFFLLLLAGLWCGAPLRGQDKKGTVVEFDSLKSRAPTTWVEQPPENAMRFMQFKLPKAQGDSRDGEVVIFKGIQGTAAENIKRWKGMFEPPGGKKIDNVATVTEMKIGGAEVTYLDVHGTYLFKAAPFVPNSKAERMPNYRMLAVVFQTKETPYHIRLVGPEKTVENYKKGFDEWLKGFK